VSRNQERNKIVRERCPQEREWEERMGGEEREREREREKRREQSERKKEREPSLFPGFKKKKSRIHNSKNHYLEKGNFIYFFKAIEKERNIKL
jgi:hypothetical protein